MKTDCVIWFDDIVTLGWLGTHKGMFPPQTRDQSSCWYQLQPEMGVSLGGAAVL